MKTSSPNTPLDYAAAFVEQTHKNLFLTGKAGTGKTTFLHNLRKKIHKRMVVVAPTGVAAINAGGVTIHSFFQLPFGPQVPDFFRGEDQQNTPPAGRRDQAFIRMSREKRNIIRSLDLLVIDEISMVRADLLDAIDAALRRYRRTTRPFGGVQLLMIGDLQQLAPVVKEDEWQMLRAYYDTPFFFSSRAIQQAGFESIELMHVYRQTDQAFIDLLNRIRENQLDDHTVAQLNKRYQPDFNPPEEEGYITLTTHNAQAGSINQKKLEALDSPSFTFIASIEGDFPEYSYPTDEELVLKEGAQVMFVKNDSSPEKRYYNGKIGKVAEIDEETIFVVCPGEDVPIEVERDTWQNMKYSINPDNQEIEETAVGTFRQVPLKLAWAITIHKSQGLTFDKAIIDARAAFAHGQVYVALSRCRSLEGLVLSSKVSHTGVISDRSVDSFNRQVSENPPDEKKLQEARAEYQQQLLADLFDFTGLLGNIRYGMKVASSNSSSLLGDPAERLREVALCVQEKMVGVANTFLKQVGAAGNAESRLIREDEALQQRIGKGCVHFLNILDEEVSALYDLVKFETDNKAVRKSLNEASSRIEETMQVKRAELEACRHGLQVSEFLEARAKASLEKPRPTGKGKLGDEVVATEVRYPDVMKQLREWRNNEAVSQGLPHYMILSQKAMAAIAHYLPASVTDLKQIKGVGKRTIEKFGNQILEITLRYREEQDIDLKMPEPPKKTAKEKKDKVPTREQTLKLFSEGKTPEQIAEIRGLTSSTIEGHLAHYVGEGTLDVLQFVGEEKLEKIAGWFHEHGTSGLTEARHALGETVSYSDLRFVMKYMQHTGQLT